MPGHPQVGQGKQGDYVGVVLSQSFVPYRHQPELALDHAKRVLHLRARWPCGVPAFAPEPWLGQLACGN